MTKEERTNRRTAVALLAVLALVVTGALVVLYAPVDPLAEFRGTDGSLHIPGAQFEALRQLLFPAPAPKDYTVYRAVQSPYPTLEVRGFTYDIPAAHTGARGLRPVGTDSWNVFFDALARLPKDIVSFFSSISPFGVAAAADRFAVLDAPACVTDSWNTTTCWAASSGGASGASVPVAGDNANFDVNSGSTTMTYDVASSTIRSFIFTTTASTSLTLAIGANTLTTSGAADTFHRGAITISTGTLNINDGVTWDGCDNAGCATSVISITGAGTLFIGNDINMNGEALITGNGAIVNTGTGRGMNISGFIVNSGNSTWTIHSNWQNFSTNASWSWTNGTIVFASNDGLSSHSMRWKAAGGAVEFNNVTFSSPEAPNHTYSPSFARTLNMNGTLTISDTVGTTIYDTSGFGSPDAIHAKNILIDSGGRIVGHSDTIRLRNDANSYGTLTVNNSGSTGGQYLLFPTSTVTVPLVVGGSGTVSGMTLIRYSYSTNDSAVISLPAVTYPELDLMVHSNGSEGAVTGTSSRPNYTLTGTTTVGGDFKLSIDGATNGQALLTTANFALTQTGFNAFYVGDGTGATTSAIVAGSSAITTGTLTIYEGIDFGTSTWNVLSWVDNNTNAATWDVGTSSVLISGLGTTLRPATGLGEPEFYDLTTTTSGAFTSSVDISTNDLVVSHILLVTDSSGTTDLNSSNHNITAETIRVTAGGRLTAGTGNLTAKTLDFANADRFTMDGFTATGTYLATDAGTIALTAWSGFTATDIAWTMNPDTAGAAVTITLQVGTASNELYDLTRDGAPLGSANADGSGNITYSVTGGWSSHNMEIRRETHVGGGLPPVVTPLPPLPSQPINPLSLFIVIGLAGLLVLFVGRGGIRTRRIGFLLLLIGIFGVLWTLNYLT